jgi:DNA-binding LacI/PurR family transcriptional regulator
MAYSYNFTTVYAFKMKNLPVTIEDIARQIGLSKATVSRALQNNRLISPSTRSRVLEAAARVGYQRPDRQRQRKLKNQPRFLFLLPPALRYPSNRSIHNYLHGLTRATNEAGCLLSVEEIPEENVGRLSERRFLPREIKANAVDVVIVADKHESADVAALSRLLPVISIQWDHLNCQVDVVSSCNYQGVLSIVKKLAQNGHRQIGWIGAPYESSFFEDRMAGFLKGSFDCGLEIQPTRIFRRLGDFLQSLDIKTMLNDGITAFVCANDNSALQVAKRALELGVRIPEDLSLTGFDAAPTPLPDGKTLTSYDPCFGELGRMAILAALHRLKDPGALQITYLCGGRIRPGETIAKRLDFFSSI